LSTVLLLSSSVASHPLSFGNSGRHFQFLCNCSNWLLFNAFYCWTPTGFWIHSSLSYLPDFIRSYRHFTPTG